MPHHTKSWSIIAHGGAREITPSEEKGSREGLLHALSLGRVVLSQGGSALDAVQAVVENLENNPVFNAGPQGSVKNENGIIEMDASIMDGKTLDIGAVAGLQNIEHPIAVARALIKDKAIFLAGDGAQQFARKMGFSNSMRTAEVAHTKSGCDTVGCVARDAEGNLAVATSTGGLEGKRAGRIGDVPLPGCGFYADNQKGGISLSGEGEAIARCTISAEFLHFLELAPADEAASKAIRLLEKVNGQAGLIAITKDGKIAWEHNTPHFAVGFSQSSAEQLDVFLKKSEQKA